MARQYLLEFLKDKDEVYSEYFTGFSEQEAEEQAKFIAKELSTTISWDEIKIIRVEDI